MGCQPLGLCGHDEHVYRHVFEQRRAGAANVTTRFRSSGYHLSRARFAAFVPPSLIGGRLLALQLVVSAYRCPNMDEPRSIERPAWGGWPRNNSTRAEHRSFHLQPLYARLPWLAERNNRKRIWKLRRHHERSRRLRLERRRDERDDRIANCQWRLRLEVDG